MKKLTKFLMLSVVALAIAASSACAMEPGEKRKQPEQNEQDERSKRRRLQLEAEKQLEKQARLDKGKQTRLLDDELWERVSYFMKLGDAAKAQYLDDIIKADDVNFINAVLDADPRTLDGIYSRGNPLIKHAFEQRADEIVISLYERKAGGDKNMCVHDWNMSLCLMLDQAQKDERSELVKALLATMRINERDEDGTTVLMHVMCFPQFSGIVPLLLGEYCKRSIPPVTQSTQADPDETLVAQCVADEWETCPVEVISECIMPFLVDISAEVNVKYNNGHTVLWYAKQMRDHLKSDYFARELELSPQTKELVGELEAWCHAEEEVIQMLEDAGAFAE